MASITFSDVQVDVINYINDRFNFNINPICALGTGLGKTIIACEIIKQIIKTKKDNFRILIIHKASNYEEPWIKELINYLLILDIGENHKNKSGHIYIHGKDREKYKFEGKYHFPNKSFFLSSYDTLTMDIENKLFDFCMPFNIVIFDELHTIINSKRLTKKTKNLYLVPAERKLALTASPIQNENEEIGLIYIFLNETKVFSDLLFLYSSNKEKKRKNKNKLIKGILNSFINLVKDNNAVYYYDEEKKGFERNVSILSLPLDEKMYDEYSDMSLRPIPLQKMYLSHPGALYKNKDISLLPRCTKADAVRIILRNMLIDEKAIIYSLYIDVLIAYSRICNELGMEAIMITGEDKGTKLKEKMKEFKNFKNCKILLTTLQYSAEGFNFNFATHVIILEFWWNPQKLMQAMGRVDRKTQTRNIFCYILCYNYCGGMVEIERIFYEKMEYKLNNANKFFKEIEQLHPKNNQVLQPYYKYLPEIILFENITTFEDELRAYLKKFMHIKNYEINSCNELSYSLTEAKNDLYSRVNNYLNYFAMLENHPWRVEIKKQNLEWYLRNIIFRERHRLPKEKIFPIGVMDNIAKRKLNKTYQFIFFDYFKFTVRLFNNSIATMPLYFFIGKLNNGNLDLLGIYNCYYFKYNEIFNDFKNRGVEKVNVFILNRKYWGKFKLFSSRQYKNSICQFCFSSILRNIPGHLIDEQTEMGIFDKIFSANKYKNAVQLCNSQNIDEGKNKDILKALFKQLPYIQVLYKLMPKNRKLICTTNIITYIIIYINILLETEIFNNEVDAFCYIYNISRKIIENGEHFIPNWNILTKKIINNIRINVIRKNLHNDDPVENEEP